MKSIKNILLILASISFIMIIGAGMYEHTTMVPRWSAAPPESLSMFQGKYGVHPGSFWPFIHPVTLLLLISALISNWRNDRKKLILWVLGSYVLVLAATAVYFVPELMRITTTAYQQHIDAGLQSSASVWEKLSLLRMAFIIVLAGILLSALTKPIEKISLN